MRNISVALTVLVGLAGLGSPAGATPAPVIAPPAAVQTVQYHPSEWRAREHWRHRRHVEWRRHEAWRQHRWNGRRG